MEKYAVVIALEGLREAREEWGKARAEFHQGYNKVLARLIHEGTRAFMSPREMASALGVGVSAVRKAMRDAGLDPKSGKRALSDQAAKALTGNAELLGIQPHEMDLTSPLAYLPMGEKMARDLRDSRVSQVHEFPETKTFCGGGVLGCLCDTEPPA